MIRLREELASALSALQDTARSIAEAQQEAGLALDEEEYVESFAPFLMDVIHAWSRARGPTAAFPCHYCDLFVAAHGVGDQDRCDPGLHCMWGHQHASFMQA